jgi:hypothetical protein
VVVAPEQPVKVEALIGRQITKIKDPVFASLFRKENRVMMHVQNVFLGSMRSLKLAGT